MKTSLDHIPQHKQNELYAIRKIIRRHAVEIGSVEMIILFGSYARGDFVERDITVVDGTTYSYISDFDILVVTKKPTQEKNMRLASEIERTIGERKDIRTPVTIVIEDIGHINARLEENRYFYADIKREGIMLYDS